MKVSLYKTINLFIFLSHEQEEKKSLLSITGRIDIFFSSIHFYHNSIYYWNGT
jgi:hypothetical protein